MSMGLINGDADLENGDHLALFCSDIWFPQCLGKLDLLPQRVLKSDTLQLEEIRVRGQSDADVDMVVFHPTAFYPRKALI